MGSQWMKSTLKSKKQGGGRRRSDSGWAKSIRKWELQIASAILRHGLAAGGN